MPGADELAFSLSAIAARLREIGETGLVTELTREVGKAVAPVPGQIRAGLRPHLPDRYADVLDADLNLTRRTFTGGEEAQVSLYASVRGTKARRIRRLDGGILWHPLFGNRKAGPYYQEAPSVLPGWFTGPVEAAVPQVRAAIDQALTNVAEKAVGR